MSHLKNLLSSDQIQRVEAQKAVLDSSHLIIAADHVHRKTHGGEPGFSKEEMYHAANAYDATCETGSGRGAQTAVIPTLQAVAQRS